MQRFVARGCSEMSWCIVICVSTGAVDGWEAEGEPTDSWGTDSAPEMELPYLQCQPCVGKESEWGRRRKHEGVNMEEMQIDKNHRMMEVSSPYSHFLSHIQVQGVKGMTVWTEGKLGASLRWRICFSGWTQSRGGDPHCAGCAVMCTQGVEQSVSASLLFILFWRTAVTTI